MLSDTDFQYLQEFKKTLAQSYNLTEDQVLKDLQCRQEYKLELNKVQARIPTKYRSFTLQQVTNPQLKHSVAYIKDYIDNLDKNKKVGVAPLLYGTAGTGKTALGCVVLMAAMQKGHSTYFTKVDECIDLLTSSWYDSDIKQEFNHKILSVDFLMIDDLGDELRSLSSNLVESTLNKVLRTRLDGLRPTILTSNLKVQNIKAIYDHRIYSILKEHALMVPCEGIDYREQVISPHINPK